MCFFWFRGFEHSKIIWERLNPHRRGTIQSSIGMFPNRGPEHNVVTVTHEVRRAREPTRAHATEARRLLDDTAPRVAGESSDR